MKGGGGGGGGGGRGQHCSQGDLLPRPGLLHSGDIIHEINERRVKGFSVDEVADLMVSGYHKNPLPWTGHQGCHFLSVNGEYSPRMDQILALYLSHHTLCCHVQ